MLSQEAMGVAAGLMTQGDFYVPAHQSVWAVLLGLHGNAQPLDAVSVAAELKRIGELDAVGGGAALLELQSRTPSTKSIGRYCDIVIQKSTLRSIIQIGTHILQEAQQGHQDPQDLLEQFASTLAGMGGRLGELPPDLYQLDNFLNSGDVAPPEWIIDDIIRFGWRVLIVAPEGAGKTTLIRHMGICAAQGIHPFRHTRIKPIKCVIIDLENPQDSIAHVCNPIIEQVGSVVEGEYDPDRAWLWWRPAGINIRQRHDRIALESILAHVRPDLVLLGPLYKLYEVKAGEGDEMAARSVMTVLDDLRVRYNFGLILEHHAPKAQGGGKRNLLPYGSSFWMRWPEIGISLSPAGEGMETLEVGRYRGDRLKNDWPSKLHRGRKWAWEAEWGGGAAQTGYFDQLRQGGEPHGGTPVDNVRDWTEPQGDDLDDEPF